MKLVELIQYSIVYAIQLLKCYLISGAKTTNQVLTTIPFISFLEDSIFVRDVVIATPWVIALEVIGKSASISEKNQKCARVLEI